MRLRDILLLPLKLSDAVREKVRREAGILDPGTLIIIGIQIVVAAISYGIQALFAPKPPPIVGPRLDDLGAPTTNTGRNIPYATGRNIAPGQIIWSTGLKETPNVDKVKGGKGGGKSTKVTTFTYSTSIAFAFNDGEVCGVQRIIAAASKILWSASIGKESSASEIDVLVNAEYDKVYAEQQIFWSAQTEPDTGVLRYTAAEVDSLSDANAQNAADKLRKDVEAQDADVQPRYSQIEFFNGTETQLPSTIIEGVKGAGNVSAFRGIAYVVIQDLELADFGNFVPPVSIDYATRGTKGTSVTVTDGEDIAPSHWGPDFFIDYVRDKIFAPGGLGGGPRATLLEFKLSTLRYVQTHDLSGEASSGEAWFSGIDQNTGYLLGSHTLSGILQAQYVYDPVGLSWKTDFENARDGTELYGDGVLHVSVITSPDGKNSRVFSTDGITFINALNFPSLVLTDTWPNPAPNPPSGVFWWAGPVNRGNDDEAWNVWISDDNMFFEKYVLANGGAITRTVYPNIHRTVLFATDVFASNSVTATPYFDPVDDTIVISLASRTSPGAGAFTGHVIKWNPATNGIVWKTEVSIVEQFILSRVNTRLGEGSIVLFGDASVVDKIDTATGVKTSVLTTAQISEILSGGHSWDGIKNCFYTGHQILETNAVFRTFCFGGVCIDDPISLTDVITGFMTRAGFAASEFQIDSAIDAETIWGFSDNSGRTSREVLEDLSRIRQIIVNEIEGKIRFRLADQATVATIPKEDVRAYDGQSSPPDWLNEVQTVEDLSLPKTLRITYQDHDRALNPATAIFTREVTQSTTIAEFSVQAVDDADAMRNSVFAAMSVLLSSKRSFKLSVPLKFAVLEPGDVVVVPVSETRTARVRIAQATLGANNIVELECNLYIDTSSLSITHTDQFTLTDTDTAKGILETELFLLDIPYLLDDAELNSDGDEDSGIYVAVGSSATGFAGANVYVDQVKLTTTETFGTITQSTGPAEWTLAGQFSVPTQAGRIVQLPDPLATALVKDTVSELAIAFRTAGAAFTTIAESLILTSQENVFLVGNEILQAQTVELIGANTYLFTDLWRGLQGTEWAIGTQSIGNDAIYLDLAAIQRVDLDNPDLINLSVDFRAATVGEDLTAVDTVSLIYTAASRKPYAPTIENVVRDEFFNLTFDLEQRNRYGADWNAGSPPFESDPNNFEVDVLDGPDGSVLRTIKVSGDNSFSYTAAQQAADFGSPVSQAFTVRPYQLNAAGVRGFTNEETI